MGTEKKTYLVIQFRKKYIKKTIYLPLPPFLNALLMEYVTAQDDGRLMVAKNTIETNITYYH